MKTKKLNKKLELSKKTISNLNSSTMDRIRAGVIYVSEVDPTACPGTTDVTYYLCRSWDIPCESVTCENCFTITGSCGGC
jgi:hypothetical protein